MTIRWMAAATAVALALANGVGEAQEPTRFILHTTDVAEAGVLNRHGLTVLSTLRDGVDRVLLVEPPAAVDVAELDVTVDADADVLGFEPDLRVSVSERRESPRLNQSTAAILESFGQLTPVSYYGSTVPSSYAGQRTWSQLGLAGVQAVATGNGIVAVIDTGVDATHPLLRDVVVSGYDFTRNVAGPATDVADLSQSTAAILEQSTAAILEQSTAAILEGSQVVLLNQSTAAILEQSTAAILESLPPAFGHGTMVAGLVHYVAPTARIMPLKAFHADGTSNLSDIVRAVYYAADHGARVINLSFSTPESSHALSYAIKYANKQAIAVAAAGNEGLAARMYPAGYSSVIAVGSATATNGRSAFSNYGDSSLKFALLGETLVTSYPGGHYAAVSGTSFSTALMSGAVAVLAQIDPGLDSGSASKALRARALAVPGFTVGGVNLPAAVSETIKRK